MTRNRVARGSIWVYAESRVLKDSAAETVSTTGGAIDVGDSRTAFISLDVTAVAGTPTLLMVIEGSQDNINWFTVGQMGANGHSLGALGAVPTNIVGVSTIRGVFVIPEFLRYRSVIGGGGPSFTYSLTVDTD